jgi:hypothetical protein
MTHGKEYMMTETEPVARIAEIMNINAVEIAINEPMSQKEAEDFVRLLSPMRNVNDGRIAEIPVNTIGKIIRHKGYDVSRIFSYIPKFFETSIFGWSEPVIQKKGHKPHRNIKEYHHYINKFLDETGVYYIRITLYEENTKTGKKGRNYIHSTAISYDINKKSDEGFDRVRVIDPGVKNTASLFYDIKLQQFLESVKPK